MPEGASEGYLTVQSTAPLYGLELINGDRGSTLAVVGPQALAAGFQAGPAAAIPRILSIDPIPAGPDGVKRISIAGQNFDNNATLYIGSRVVAIDGAGSNGRLHADLPGLEPGYVNVKVRAR